MKILGELVDTFDSYALKQEINLGFEVQGALQAIKEDLTSSSSSIDQGFSELVDQFKQYGDRAFGKKRFFIKFLQEIGGENNFQSSLLSGAGYNAWYDARQIQKDINELEKTQDYKSFMEGVNVLKAQITKKDEELSSFEEKIKKISQDIKDIEALLETIRKNLDDLLQEFQSLI